MPRINYRRVSLFLLSCSMLFTFLNLYSKHVPSIDPKIDWEDHKYSKKNSNKSGPGEQSSAVSLNSGEKDEIVLQMMKKNGFNALVSDAISLERSMKDLRLEECKSLKYSRDLPSVSVVIPFHEEHRSTLLRTIHTLLSRTPRTLVQEVILVDDFSMKSFLKTGLEQYIRDTFDKVRIIRTLRREGLIRARLLGARAALSPVMVFMDSHCEFGANWLPPLLEPILENYRTVTCPTIDVINYDNFSIHPQDEGARGLFNWNLEYKRVPRSRNGSETRDTPFQSPVMSGGLFAISRNWFWELDGYDPELQLWGGEQYELSFKIWMCGGSLLEVPCSRVAHVYRKFNPFGVTAMGDVYGRNLKRVAEVWMDDWKKYLYKRNPSRYDDLNPGDLSRQKSIRQRLNCRSFDWYMKEVAFDMLKIYPVVEPKPIASGRIVSDADPTMCINNKSGTHTSLGPCIHEDDKQRFEYTWRLEIRQTGRNMCFDFSGTSHVLNLLRCHNFGGTQSWKYNFDTHQIIHETYQTCIDSNHHRSEIFMGPCQSSSRTQKWTFKEYNEDTKLKAQVQ